MTTAAPPRDAAAEMLRDGVWDVQDWTGGRYDPPRWSGPYRGQFSVQGVELAPESFGAPGSVSGGQTVFTIQSNELQFAGRLSRCRTRLQFVGPSAARMTATSPCDAPDLWGGVITGATLTFRSGIVTVGDSGLRVDADWMLEAVGAARSPSPGARVTGIVRVSAVGSGAP